MSATRNRHVICILAGLLGFSLCAGGAPAELHKTRTELRKIDQQIRTTQKNLDASKTKRNALTRALAVTDKQIGQSIREMEQSGKALQDAESRIRTIRQRIDTLNSEMEVHTSRLRTHLLARHRMGPWQPFKWFLNTENPARFTRLMVYYHRLVAARKDVMEKTRLTREHLQQEEEALQATILKRKALKTGLTRRQHQLEEEKRYRQGIVAALDRDIASKGTALQEFRRNRENLGRLLDTLARQSARTTATPRPFGRLQKRLPWPVKVARDSVVRTHQGITFFAAEGQPVTAVQGGKVVFSDWLNGYGLLMIVDHGQGFMTLYGHNQSLRKHKGETVQAGEAIATVGHTGTLRQNGLYFEVRQRGKAVPPLQWLS